VIERFPGNGNHHLSKMLEFKHGFTEDKRMERLTELLDGKGEYATRHVEAVQDGFYGGKAVEELAKFENLYEHMEMRMVEIPKQLAELRDEGKEKSYRFREIFAQKLTIEAFLEIMKDFGIKQEKPSRY